MNNNRRRNFRGRSQKSNFRRRNINSSHNNNHFTSNVGNRSFSRNGHMSNHSNIEKAISKFQQLAKDAQSSGDPVLVENYLQHADHYSRRLAEINDKSSNSNNSIPQANAESVDEKAEIKNQENS